jgi:hypothetical protein
MFKSYCYFYYFYKTLHFGIFRKNLAGTFKFRSSLTIIRETLPEELFTFMTISRSILLRMRNISDKFAEKIKIDVLCSIRGFFFSKIVHSWDNVEKCGRTEQATEDNMVRRMRIACWIPKATNTHSEYVILFFFFAATVV